MVKIDKIVDSWNANMAAEDDEIDILGDFSMDDCINKNEKTIGSSYSDLLKCDYSVHPQWLLDTVTTANWYDTPSQEENVMKSDGLNVKTVNSEDEESQPSTSSGFVEWTIYEKELLKKAMDIYGRDYNRIAVFLGSKSMQEVKMLIEAEYGINLDCDTPKTLSTNNIEGASFYGEVLTENEIPASIEEVICMVSTAEPTVPGIKTAKTVPNEGTRSVLSKHLIANNTNRSLLKKPILNSDNTKQNFKTQPVKSPSKRGLPQDYKDQYTKLNKVYSYAFSNKKTSNVKKNMRSPSKSKFNISLMMNKKDALSQLSPKKKSFTTGKKRGVRQKSVSESGESFVEKPVMQIVTGSGQALPLFEGEQVIKIEKRTNSEAESDIEVDIDSDDDKTIAKNSSNNYTIYSSHSNNDGSSSHLLDQKDLKNDETIVKTKPAHDVKIEMPIVDIPEDIQDVLTGMDPPQEEYIVISGEITNLEKFLCAEFFEGRSAKTPERYMAIRTHLIQSWRMCRPNYLTKTAARQGLRNCGDVNCIGKVHTLMEQLGAINFNCDQTSYIRPLHMLLTRNTTSNIPSLPHSSKSKFFDDSNKLSAIRQRKKRIVVDGEGGYTITHTEFGETYEVVGEPKQQKIAKKKQTNLIYCKSFSHDHPPPFSVTISLSALILMDFHAHTSHAEVMGLLGGRYDPHASNVHIQHYVPCDSLEDSGTHCDMCPVSQSEAGEALSALGVDTVGWHHSHPLFPPWPSSQDLLTQQDLQAALAPTPCLAVILSPYWQPGRTSSQYKCLYVKNDVSSGETLAFRFKTHIECDLITDFAVESLLQDIIRILDKKEKSSGNYFVNMSNDICPNAQVTYLDKCISSISYHLKGCEIIMGITKCKEIVTSIRNLAS